MNEEKDEEVQAEPVVQEEVVQEVKRFNCDNCEDSGRECYVCNAGRQVE